MNLRKVVVLGCGVLLAPSGKAAAGEHVPAAVAPVVPPGFSIERVAGPPLVERPIVASFDDEGRLYVAESSGSNDPVEQQLELRPHRIVRLEDIDGDGVFDRRTVFADRMMLPEGALFLDGSLYVAAPPSIWKLSDRDGDGVAEERVEWFEGRTLTGCANDLHGPYLGPDGWLYWCKGAFAEQTHTVRGRPWKTRAAHIFRRHPAGGELEPVMTGGMDNPVDVAFLPDGERIFSTTYLVGEGRQDALVHAIYGGVYGKPHGVLDGHPRTGELMPAVTTMGAAAPCGLERYAGTAFGDDFRDNLLLCQFNLRKVSRHVLRPSGSSYVGEELPFVSCEHVDFHPTDVLTDADGSVLVIDTGGWYKLCCPTSHLWKPDVLGAIYRVRRVGAPAVDDPRGRRIAWNTLGAEELWTLLSDSRFAVRDRAGRELVRRRDSKELRELVSQFAAGGHAAALAPPATRVSAPLGDAGTAALARLWMFGQIDSEDAQTLVRRALDDGDEIIRHAAMQIVSLRRDAVAAPRLIEILRDDSPANRRLAAEALGRLGDAAAVPHLLAAAAHAGNDRILQHSLIFALIEIDKSQATQAGLASQAPGTIAAALIALDQMPRGGLASTQAIPLLNVDDDGVREAARWVVSRHPEWGGELAGWFGEQLAALHDASNAAETHQDQNGLTSMLASFAAHPAIQEMLASTIADRASSIAARLTALRVMGQSNAPDAAPSWSAALAGTIAEANTQLLPQAVEAAQVLASAQSHDHALIEALRAAAAKATLSPELRAGALAALPPGMELNDGEFQLLIAGLAEASHECRADAAGALSRARLAAPQLRQLSEAIAEASPLEINPLLAAFAQSHDRPLLGHLVESLRGASALASVRFDQLRQSLAGGGEATLAAIDELESLVNVDAAGQRRRIEELLPLMAEGDVRRGHVVFYSSKAACTACHQLGIGGGTIGPDLSEIGKIRTTRDLLESILYPSLSFVRSYEPVLILTADGKAVSGTVRDETAEEMTLVTAADQTARIRRADIEEIAPGTISVMPAGLDKVLTTQELADLVTFLKTTTDE
jgi:putative membrane-bound dehydrogenase-like protein